MSIFGILGPVMIGPSSSHTAGAVNIGMIARQLLRKKPVEAEIILYGSFAATYHGHGTDRAIIAGILGFSSDDYRIKDALDIAADFGLEYQIHENEGVNLYHPNAARLRLTDGVDKLDIIGISVGGGEVRIVEIDTFKVNISGNYDTLLCLYPDQVGIVLNVSQVLVREGVNIASMSVFRDDKSDTCMMIVEVDGELSDKAVVGVSDLPLFYSVRSMKKIEV